jgi:hypothetical protein
MRKILYIDMDGVLIDCQSGIDHFNLDENVNDSIFVEDGTGTQVNARVISEWKAL